MTELSERVEAWKSTVEPGSVDQLVLPSTNPRSFEVLEGILFAEALPLGDQTRNKVTQGWQSTTNC